MLPKDFQIRMQEMLQEEYADFLASYSGEKYQGLRFNPLKVNLSEFVKKNPFHLTPIPWAEYGYYYEGQDQPGKHVYHEAGVYYIQEPSAMAPAEYLEAQPGERILDLCAAPGGKSTQIAASMNGQGLLISNEIHPARAKILSENIERMGIRNAIVTNETPRNLADTFIEYFDRIMVDAPCSGEGMFRKNEAACEEWSLENVSLCATRQEEILDCAASMLRPGGRIVYSTCTFAPSENEESINRFVKRHPEFSVVEIELVDGMEHGIAEWAINPVDGIERTIRLWPHKLRGEGHYIAVLQKEGSISEEQQGSSKYGEQQGISEKECKEYITFRDQYMRVDWKGLLLRFGDQLYLAPKGLPSLHKLKVLRPGLHLGTLKKNRFEPSHALALALHPEEVTYHKTLSANETVSYAYLNGQTFESEGEKGWYLILVDGYSIGWGKLTGGTMKNHYPKGLRKHYV